LNIGKFFTRKADRQIKDQVSRFFESAVAKSGVSVSEDTALKYTAVFACVRVISETIASLPLFLYQRLDRGKRKATEHPHYKLLHLKPNPEITSFQFRETLQAHLLLWGNAYAEIEWGNDGWINGLWIITPNRVNPKRDETGNLVYDVCLPKGGIVTLSKYQMLHLKGLSYSGLYGYSPISLAREAIGLGIASEEFASRFYQNDATPGGALKHKGQLSDKAYERLKKFWNERFQGLSNAHRVAILEEGMDWQSVGIPAKDAQFIETRKFQKTEIAAIYRVPPHLIADLERATFSNIEHQSIEFVIHCIRPWAVRWEQELSTSLLLPGEQDNYFYEFLLDALLRGDTESRYRAYATGRQWGWLSANDIRELENMNPLPDGKGDIYLVPLNMVEAWNSKSETKSVRTETRKYDYKRIFNNFEPAIKTLVEKIIKREESDIMRFVGKEKEKARIEGFIEKFYQEHSEYIKKNAVPVFLTYAGTINDFAKGYINGIKDCDADAFVKSFTDVWATEHNFYSHRYLKNKLQKTDDVKTVFQNTFNEWKTKRVEKITQHLLVRLFNAVSLEVYKLNGIQKKKWIAGENESPFCKDLDGKIIPISDYFFTRGTEIVKQNKKLKLWRDIKHPPLTKNCFCVVEPVIVKVSL